MSRGGNPWDFADNIQSAVNNAIDMHYKEKQMQIDEKRYNDNMMMTMFAQEEKSLRDSFKEQLEVLKMVDDPELVQKFMVSPDYENSITAMDNLRDRKMNWFRQKGMPEEQIVQSTRSLNFNPFKDTLEKTMGPRSEAKKLFNKYWNPLDSQNMEGDFKGYNVNSLRHIRDQWVKENPGAHWTEFAKDPTVRKYFEDEQLAYNQFASLPLDNTFLNKYGNPIKNAHSFIDIIEGISAHNDTLEGYMEVLQEEGVITNEERLQYQERVKDAWATADQGAYERINTDLDSVVKQLDWEQDRFNDLYKLEMMNVENLSSMAKLEMMSSDQIQGTTIQAFEDAQKNLRRLEKEAQNKNRGILTPTTTVRKTKARELTNIQKANNILGEGFASGIQKWNSDRNNAPVIAKAVNALIKTHPAIFGDTQFTDKQGADVATNGRATINTPQGGWNVQAVADNPELLVVWDDNQQKKFLITPKTGKWVDARTGVGLSNLNEMPVAGIGPGDIISGNLNLGGMMGSGHMLNDKYPNIKYLQYAGKEDGNHVLLGVNKKGQMVDKDGNVTDKKKNQFKWTSAKYGLNWGNLSEQARDDAFIEQLMNPDSRIRHHGSPDYWDEEGTVINFQRGNTSPVNNLPLSQGVDDNTFGTTKITPDEVEVE